MYTKEALIKLYKDLLNKRAELQTEIDCTLIDDTDDVAIAMDNLDSGLFNAIEACQDLYKKEFKADIWGDYVRQEYKDEATTDK